MQTKLKAILLINSTVFLLYAIWWVLLSVGVEPFNLTGDHFTDTYGIVAAIGSIGGLLVARMWGGWQSQMGRALGAISLGLLAQFAGQITYSIYFYVLGIEIPYPSWGDVGFFGSVLLYIYGVYALAKVSGVKVSLKVLTNKLQAILIPAILLIASYLFFLQDYEHDPTAPLTTFLDFGYPFGQAIYISLAVLTYSLSRKILGGIMKNKILFLLGALLVQYIADFTFVYRNNLGIWEAGGLSDFIYLSAYIVMTFALIKIGQAYNEVRAK